MAFRPALTELRRQWEQVIGGLKNPADGFFLINELRSPRKHQRYPQTLIDAYQSAITSIASTIQMPIRYAGPGEWSIFEKPQAYNQVASRTVAVPGTRVKDRCLVISLDLWATFRQMSLWVEALCIHEWCLFSGRVSNHDRGCLIYCCHSGGVRVITTLSSLGLEFKAVLLLWIEQFEDCFAEDLDMRSLARRQLYVAMTRAQDELHLIAGGAAAVVAALGKSEAVEVASMAKSAGT